VTDRICKKKYPVHQVFLTLLKDWMINFVIHECQKFTSATFKICTHIGNKQQSIRQEQNCVLTSYWKK
jgi:hypothetical protein